MDKKRKGVSAVIATILMLMITIALAGMAYMYISGIFTAKTGVVIDVDETATYCASNVIYVSVRDSGTMPTYIYTVQLSGSNSQGGTITFGGFASRTCNSTTPSTVQLYAGGASVQCTSQGVGTQGTNTIVVAGPSNTVRGSVYCP